MDSGKYVDMAVQNPHGKEMVRLIFLPRNFNIFLDEMERFMPSLRNRDKYAHKRKSKNKHKSPNERSSYEGREGTKKYALEVLYDMIWAFGVLRLPQRSKSYWLKRSEKMTSTRSPWGEIPMEIYIVDHFLDDVISPQCPW